MRPVCRYSRQRLQEPSEQAEVRGRDRDGSLRKTWAAQEHKATIPAPVSASQCREDIDKRMQYFETDASVRFIDDVECNDNGGGSGGG